MKTVFIISTIFLLLSCSSPDKQTAVNPPTVVTNEINTRDTCLRILKTYAQADTFLYERFFDERTFNDGRLSYVRTGALIYPDKKSAVIVYTPTDTTIAVELYSFDKNKWLLNDKKLDLATNGLMFYSVCKDYNFDGIGDIYINTCVSNGSGLSTGHLLTVTSDGHLVTHPETIDIRDMEPDSANKIVKAKYPLGCMTYKTICDQTYKWVDNKLTLVSKPCKCKE